MVRAGGLHRRRAGVVLGRHHEHAVPRLGDRLVGERLALLAVRLEPDLHRVARPRAGHDALHDPVVDRCGLVALTAPPLRGARAPLAAAVDLVLDRHAAELALGQHADGLRVAVGVLEREVRARDALLVRVVAADVERLGLDAQRGLRVVRVLCGVRDRLGERQVPLELGLDERLVVGEHEPAARAPLGQLGGPRQRLADVVRVVVGLAVGHVQHVGAEPRVVAGDGRLVEVARQRVVDRVVRRRGADLPALRVQQPLAGGVVVDVEGEADPLVQALDRLRLGLRAPGRAAVGLAREDLRRAFLVVLEVLGVVAVGVDAVDDRRLAVAVVVAQVLTPQPLVVERVLVAVRVHDRDEPQLGLVEQLADLAVAVVAADVVEHQPPVGLRRDPLAGMLGGAEQHRRALAVAHLARAVGHLEREDLAAVVGPADPHQLRDVRVLARDLVHLVAEAAGLVVRAPDVEPVLRLRGRELLDRLAALDARERGLDAVGREPRPLVRRQDQLQPHVRAGALAARDVQAVSFDLRGLVRLDHGGVHLEPVRGALLGSGGGHERTRQGSRQRGRQAPSMHTNPPQDLLPASLPHPLGCGKFVTSG